MSCILVNIRFWLRKYVRRVLGDIEFISFKTEEYSALESPFQETAAYYSLQDNRNTQSSPVEIYSQTDNEQESDI